jgi:hypothetical protein
LNEPASHNAAERSIGRRADVACRSSAIRRTREKRACTEEGAEKGARVRERPVRFRNLFCPVIDSLRTIVALELTADGQLVVENALRAGWPAATVSPAASLSEALARNGASGREVLLVGPGVPPADRDRAAQVVDRDGLSRWPVVVCGRGVDTGMLSYLPADDLSPEEFAGRLKAIALGHDARRAESRARGDLCTIARRISHEMRSPLGCIVTSAEVLREEFSQHPGAIDALVQPILDSATEMTRLINQLTTIARATAAPVASTAVDVGLAAWNARERLASRIMKTGAELTEPETWPEAWGVFEWVEQVWENLLANALDHAGENPRVDLGWERTGGGLRFFVRDRGQGVSADARDRLFRPFHQLHRIDSGRGIGLSLVQRLVELQGGQCGHESVDPHGACFHFTLPPVPESNSAG